VSISDIGQSWRRILWKGKVIEMETMTAAVFEGPGKFMLKDVPVPAIERADQVILRVNAVSICGTDVHITSTPPGYAATPGTVLGHELVGTVQKKGADVGWLEIGDRVVVNPNNYCGTCYYCRKNMPNECLHVEPLGIDFDGAFAKYCRVSGKVAYKISKSVPVEAACMAEPLACAVNGLNKIKVKPGDSAVVIGCGPIGLIIAMLLEKQGAAPIYLFETSVFRAEFAQKILGFSHVLNPAQTNAAEAVLAALPHGVGHVFDVTGSQMVTAVSVAAKGANVVLFGVNKNSKANVEQHIITTKEVTVHGTWLANATFPAAVEIIEKNVIDIQKLITQTLPLEKIKDGLDLLACGQAIKVIIIP
jgi:threonine dehydrogenase-like Zn-dependent dehydrogenase